MDFVLAYISETSIKSSGESEGVFEGLDFL